VVNNLHSKRVRGPQLASETSVRTLVRIEVGTDAGVPDKLLRLIDIPIRIDALLKSSQVKISSLGTAKLWLLENWKDLSKILNIHDRDKAVDALNQFLPFWLEHHRTPDHLSILSGCELSQDSKLLRLGQDIGWIRVRYPDLVQLKRKAWITYSRSFDLKKFKNKYVVELSAVIDKRRLQVEMLTCSNQNTLRETQESDWELFGKGLDSHRLFKAMSLIFSQIDRAAAAYKKPNFDDLQGRPVSGGLPGSGKRR
jgi:hypothetical protein